MEWREVNGSRFDASGMPRTSYEQTLEKNRAELAFLTPLFETAYRENYDIAWSIQERINSLRAAIYWAERKLAME